MNDYRKALADSVHQGTATVYCPQRVPFWRAPFFVSRPFAARHPLFFFAASPFIGHVSPF